MVETKKPARAGGEKDKFNLNVDQMAQSGLHFGHRTSRINPKMQPYLSGVRNGVHVIDLEKTKEKLTEALDFTQKLIADSKVLVLVGTKIQIKNMVKEMAQECDLPYVVERWLGGTFTNLSTILKRVNYYKDLEKKRDTGELEKYTKKERSEFDKEIKKLEIKFKGIRNLNKLPDAIFVCDMIKDRLAVKEAQDVSIKVIGICDTNVDPTLADFPIPASDDAVPSVKYVLDKFKEVILKSKPKVKAIETK